MSSFGFTASVNLGDENNSNTFFANKYLNSPIVDVNRRLARKDLKDTPPDAPPVQQLKGAERRMRQLHARLLTECPNHFFSDRPMEDSVAWIEPSEYTWWFHEAKIPYHEAAGLLTRALSTITPILKAAGDGLSTHLGTPLNQLPAPSVTDEMVYFYQSARFFERVVEQYDEYRGGSPANRDPFVHSFPEGKVVMSGAIVYFINPCDLTGIYGMTYEQLLMFKDACLMRFNAILTVQIHYPESNLTDLCMDMFKIQEHCLETYDNLGYEGAKAVESTGRARLTVATGDILGGEGSSYENVLIKLYNKELGWCQAINTPMPKISIAARYHMLWESVTELSHVVELFGLQKFSGHPIITPELGGLASATEARTPDRTLPSAALSNRAAVCHIVMENFIRKNHRYPRLRFTEGQSCTLKNMYRKGRLNIQRGSYPLLDWNHTSFEEEFEFDYSDNWLELIDDKALSHKRSEIATTWYDSVPATSDRRLLLVILKSEFISTRAMVEAVEDETLTPDEFIVTVTPKEREFKIAARMFAMLCLRPRCINAIAEMNVAESVLPYVPQITMMESKQEVHERLLQMSTPPRDPRKKRLLLELDLSKWNLNWRGYAVNLIGQDMNDLFGMRRFFTFAHDFFSKSLIVVRVNDLPPEGILEPHPPESDLVWRGHLGGFEGQIQKMWSLCTVGMIALALWDLQASYSLMVQGDNVIVMILLFFVLGLIDPADVVAQLRKVLVRCAETTAAVGQDLKPEECVESTTVITYSKWVFVNGMDYPTTVKALSRLFPESSQDFPSVPTFIGSIFSGSLAAAEGAKAPMSCYVNALMLASLYLHNACRSCGVYTHSMRGSVFLNTEEGKQLALTLPSELGGWPVLTPFHYLYGGGSDPLMKSVSGVRLLQGGLPILRRVMSVIHSGVLMKETPTYDMIISDPYGLPLDKPVTPADSVAEATLVYMRSLNKNQALATVLSAGLETYREALVKTLSTMTPFDPRMAHDLLSASVIGTQDQVKRMMTNTRTMQTEVRERGATSITPKLVLQGTRQIAYMDVIYSKLTQGEYWVQSVRDCCLYLRSFWDKIGADVGHITTYSPLDFPLHHNPSEDIPGVKVRFYGPRSGAQYVQGHFKPYKGSKTKEKLHEQGYKIHGRTLNAVAVKKMVLIRSHMNLNPDSSAFFDQLSESRSGVKVSAVHDKLTKVKGGTPTHRYRGEGRGMDAHSLGTDGYATHTSVETDSAGYLSGTLDDYPIMFQEMILFTLAAQYYRYLGAPGEEYTLSTLEMGILPLDKITIPHPEIHPEAPLPPLPQSSNSLFYDQDLEVRKISGPTLSQAFATLPLPAPKAELDLSVYALIRRMMSGKHYARSVLEMEVTAPKLPFDIQELRAFGINTYLVWCAVYLIEHGIPLLQSTDRRDLVNSTFMAYFLTTGRQLISALYPMLLHPMFTQDPIISRLNLGPAPRYSADGAGKSRLLSVLLQYVFNNLEDPKSTYHRSPRVLYTDDAPNSLVPEVANLLRRECSKLVASHQISAGEMHFCVGTLLHHLARITFQSEEERQQHLILQLYAYRNKRQGNTMVPAALVGLCDRIARCASKHRILLSRHPATEVIRDWRPLAQPHELAPSPMIRGGYAPIARFSIIPDLGRASAHVYHTLDPLDRFLIKHELASGLTHTYGSRACQSWMSIRGLLRPQDHIVVGSGLGGAATAAILAGAGSVIGLDLKKDIAWETTSIGIYVPPVVRLYRKHGQYMQSHLSVTTDGDWLNPSVHSSLLQDHGKAFTFLFDIPGQADMISDVIAPLIGHEWQGDTIFRLTGSPASVARATSILAGASSIEYYGTCHVLTTYTEAFVLCVRFHKGDHGLYQSLYPANAHRITLSSKYGIDTTWELLTFLLAPLGGVTGVTVRDALVNAKQHYLSLKGSYVGRPSYSSWGDILTTVVSVEILLTPYIGQKAILARVIAGDGCPVDLLEGHNTMLYPASYFPSFFTAFGSPFQARQNQRIIYPIESGS